LSIFIDLYETTAVQNVWFFRKKIVMLGKCLLSEHYEILCVSISAKGSSPKCRCEFALSEYRSLGMSLQIRDPEP
jgi:hypothetical protein